ncbi:hypothetical protein N7516_003825 [Penicillium verrucosum]|uniref:uncharacterized protein n=1 Tax=Penicillium verrucosum TaxID=60171 RepID=UPI0025451F85|nr:uncharacterized protein N7516_003825 [Penicillium verrucosum]KAJ5943657.1 hypothetical protein N7516_003825 [Penicillium verrucosum]
MNFAASSPATEDLPLSKSKKLVFSATSWGVIKPDIINEPLDLTNKERVLPKDGRRVNRRRTLR